MATGRGGLPHTIPGVEIPPTLDLPLRKHLDAVQRQVSTTARQERDKLDEILESGMIGSQVTPTYGPSVPIDASLGDSFRITVTDTVAFTIVSPTNIVTGQRLTVMLRNTSGHALGAVTWDTAYKLAAWTSPATGNSRSIDYVYDGTNAVEVSRTTADIPN